MNEVRFKCYKMPYWDDSSIDDNNSDEDEPEANEYIAAAIIYTYDL